MSEEVGKSEAPDGGLRYNEGLGVDFCHQLNGDCHDYFKLRVERDQYREKTSRAWLALKQVLGHIHAANEGGLITDTLWYDMHTTLVEYVEHEIDALDA